MKTSNLEKLIPAMCALPCLFIGLHVEGAANVASILAMELGTAMLGKAWGNLKERWFPSKFVHEEIQNALIDAFADALQILKEEFFNLPDAQALSKESKDTIKLVFKDLNNQGQQILSTSRLHLENEQSFADFLLIESLETHNELMEQLEGSGLLENLMGHEQLFVNFILSYFVSRWQRSFKRRIKDDDPAYKAFMMEQTIKLRNMQEEQSQTLKIIKEDVGWLRQRELAHNIPVSNLPRYDAYFFSHQHDVLEELRRELLPGRKLVLTGHQGVGKTLTALEYAHQLHEEENSSAFWISAESDEQFLNEFVGLAALLGVDISAANTVHLQDRAEQLQAAARKVRDALGQRKNWLLVIDNLDGWFFANNENDKVKALLENILPSPLTGRVLITSYDRPSTIEKVNGYHALELKMMNLRDGARFLLMRAGLNSALPQDDVHTSEANLQIWRDALAISQSVEGLPLALDQAAAYIKQMPLGFSLSDYLLIYFQEGQHFITQAAYQGTHKPVVATFSLALKRLQESSQASSQLAGELLKLFTMLAPTDISLQIADIALTNLIAEMEEQSEKDFDILDVLQEAYDLRLLNYDAHQQMISLHQVVHDVIWEIICYKKEDLIWLARAAQIIASVFKAPDLSNDIVYPHVHGLSLRIQLLETKEVELEPFWQQLRNIRGGKQLWEMLADIKVLAAIEDGARWEILLLGTEDPSFDDIVHSVANFHTVEDPRWQERSEHMLASISRVCSPNRARNIFLCLAMLVHYWWSSYMPDETIAEPLLAIWQRTHPSPKDQKLVAKLRHLFSKYPPEREERRYEARGVHLFRSQWKAVATTSMEIREMLVADIPAEEQDTPSFRYASAMLNMYEAQARTAVLQTGHEPDEVALTLLEEAEGLLWENNDFFHAVWTIRELSEAQFRLARQYLQLSDFRKSESDRLKEKAAERFAYADHTAVRGIETLVMMAEQQDTFLDLEFLSTLFRLRADIVWQVNQDSLQAELHRCFSLYLAYIWIQDELDVYSVEFFNEHVERAIAWWQELKDTSPDSLAEVFKLMRLFWQGSPSTSLTPMIESHQWEKLRLVLLPEGLSRTGLLEETAVNKYLQKAAQTEASMLTRVAELSKNYQYEISDSFIKILKLRAASPN